MLHAAQVRPATKLQAGGCITCSPSSQRSIYLAGIKTLILQCRTSGSFILMAIRSVVTAVVPVVILFVVLCARKPGMLCIVQCKFCTAHIEQNLFPLRSVWQRDWKPCTELLPLCSGEMLRNCPSALLGRAASELVVETFWARWWWLPACRSVLTPNELICEGCRFFPGREKTLETSAAKATQALLQCG